MVSEIFSKDFKRRIRFLQLSFSRNDLTGRTHFHLYIFKSADYQRNQYTLKYGGVSSVSVL